MAKGSKYKIGEDTYQEAVDTRDDGGKSFLNAFDWKKGGYDVTKDSFYKPDIGEKYKVNILPFIVKSENNPQVVKGKTQLGKIAYKLDVYIHKNVGPDKGSVICPNGTYGKPCPICDEHETLKAAAETKKEIDAANKLKKKHRSLFNVQVIEKGEPQPVQIFDVSHFRFTKELLDEAASCANGAEPLPFADPEDGSVVSFRTAKSDLSKYDIIYKAFSFIDRDEDIEDDLIESECISFDDCMVVYTAEELDMIMNGEMDMIDSKDDAPEADADADEAPAKPPAKEKPAKKEKSDKAIDTCPEDLNFAEDYDTEKVCDECQVENPKCWKACAKANAIL